MLQLGPLNCSSEVLSSLLTKPRKLMGLSYVPSHCVETKSQLSGVVSLTYGSLRWSESAPWYLPCVRVFLCDVMESYVRNGIFYNIFMPNTLPRPRQ